MKKNANLEVYFCTQCKTKSHNVEDLLVVEDFYSRPFCSEECILEFYGPMITEFEDQENELRTDLAIKDPSSVRHLKNDKKLIAQLIDKPHEKLLYTNGLGEEYYLLFQKFKYNNTDLYSIGVAFYHDETVSMMIFHTVTSSLKLVSAFKIGKSIEDESEIEDENIIQDFKIDQKLMEELELKKSNILSELLVHRKNTDIPFESFPYYERFTKLTLNDPDEVYEFKDQYNDSILTYIKAFQSNKIFNDGSQAFYHIVLAIKVDEDENENQDILLPILAFPSTDSSLYKRYKAGERLTGSLKN